MKKIIQNADIKNLLMSVLLILLTAPVFADDVGMTSFPVLQMDNFSARALSMANTAVSVKGDLNSQSVNPANIASVQKITFSASRMQWLFDTGFNSMNFIFPLPMEDFRYGVLGLTANIMDSSAFDALINGQSLASQIPGDFYIGLSYAANIFGFADTNLANAIHLDAGFTVKYAQQKLLDYTAGGLAFDLGLSYSINLPTVNDMLGIAEVEVMTATNIITIFLSNSVLVTNAPSGKGKKIQIEEKLVVQEQVRTNIFKVKASGSKKRDSFSAGLAFRNLTAVLYSFVEGQNLLAPWIFDFGLSYIAYRDKRHNAMVALDISKPSDGYVSAAFGVEYSYKNTIFLRGGYKIGRETDGLSFGVGLNFELLDHLSFQLDYAQSILGTLGNNNVFSLSVLF